MYTNGLLSVIWLVKHLSDYKGRANRSLPNETDSSDVMGGQHDLVIVVVIVITKLVITVLISTTLIKNDPKGLMVRFN